MFMELTSYLRITHVDMPLGKSTLPKITEDT